MWDTKSYLTQTEVQMCGTECCSTPTEEKKQSTESNMTSTEPVILGSTSCGTLANILKCVNSVSFCSPLLISNVLFGQAKKMNNKLTTSK